MQITITNGTLTQVQETLTASSGYTLPSSISVSGAISNYDNSTGAITLTNLTSIMSITAVGTVVIQPSISIGTSALTKAFLGTVKLSSIWLGNTKLYEKQITPPSISLSGTIVTITDADDRVTEFDVYADDTFKFTISATGPGAGAIFDINALELGTGTHIIKTKAKATGLVTSDFSNSITYILNEDIILDEFTLSVPNVVFVYDA